MRERREIIVNVSASIVKLLCLALMSLFIYSRPDQKGIFFGIFHRSERRWFHCCCRCYANEKKRFKAISRVNEANFENEISTDVQHYF